MKESTTHGKMFPGLDNGREATAIRKELGVKPIEWLKLSWEDRLELIEAYRKELL